MYKSASGCIEHINIFQVSNINSTLKNLKDRNFWVYGFDSNAKKNFTEIKWEGNNILLFGSEGFGMRKHTAKYADFFVSIDGGVSFEKKNLFAFAWVFIKSKNLFSKSKTSMFLLPKEIKDLIG